MSLPAVLPLPSSEDSETFLLACVLARPEMLSRLASETCAGDFTGSIRPVLRDLILRLATAGLTVTISSLEAHYCEEHVGTALPAAPIFDALRVVMVHAPNWEWHLGRTRSSRIRREVLRESEQVSAMAWNGHGDAEVLRAGVGLSKTVAELSMAGQDMVSGEEASRLLKLDYLDSSRSLVDLGMGPPGRPFGGVRSGEVFTLLARTWVGKSLWAAQAALNCAAPVLVVSLEMPAEQWWNRTLMQLWNVPRHEARSRHLTGQMALPERAALQAAEKRIVLTRHCKPDEQGLTAAIAKAERILGTRPRLIVIDHLQFLHIGPANASTYQRASEAVVAVKQLAKREDVAILLLSQVGRAEGSDGSAEVGMGSARDSGQIEEAADFLLGLWRPSHKKGLGEVERRALEPEIHGRLLKNRRGGSYEWRFRLDTLTLRITPERPEGEA